MRYSPPGLRFFAGSDWRRTLLAPGGAFFPRTVLALDRQNCVKQSIAPVVGRMYQPASVGGGRNAQIKSRGSPFGTRKRTASNFFPRALSVTLCHVAWAGCVVATTSRKRDATD